MGGIESAPQVYARLAGGFYVITILAGSFALLSASGRLAANLVAAACYVAVTVLFYYIFRPVNQPVSFLAALLSLMGCLWGALSAFRLAPIRLSPLVFFGVYCLLIAYLTFKSTFLPRFLAGLMALGGVGWLTFLVPPLATALTPYNMFPGILGETALTMWLLVRGLDVPKWREQAHTVHA